MILEDVAEIQVEIQDESESPDTIEIEILETGPEGPQGEPGYTPVKGVDYWTEEDKDEIKSYCDSLVIDVLGGSY